MLVASILAFDWVGLAGFGGMKLLLKKGLVCRIYGGYETWPRLKPALSFSFLGYRRNMADPVKEDRLYA